MLDSTTHSFAAWTVEQTPQHVHAALRGPFDTLSSGVLNGGATRAEHIVNLKVDENFMGRKTDFEPVETTLQRYCHRMRWQGTAVGMMTAATMDSFRLVQRVEQGEILAVAATAGISNARRAGDPAEYRWLGADCTRTGTINLILLTTARLTPAAMVEAVMVATEAKGAALGDLGVRTPLREAPATGTGTDAIVVASGREGTEIRYCGKHMLMGEMIAGAVIKALTGALQVRK